MENKNNEHAIKLLQSWLDEEEEDVSYKESLEKLKEVIDEDRIDSRKLFK